MFKTFAKSGLAGFRLVQLRRIAPQPRRAALPSHPYLNDNLPGLRRPAAAGKRRSSTPALACHWVDRDGRLECCWHLETDDAPRGGIDKRRRSAPGDTSGGPPIQPPRLALAG